jgi:hypothetical protein
VRLFATVALAASLAAFSAIAAPRPWQVSDKPPVVAGIKLGDSEQHALDVLGAPDDAVPNADSEVLYYNAKGLEVTATKKDGVVSIKLLTPDAGAIDGVKVGDIARDVLLKWGAPTTGEGRIAVFGPPAWGIGVHLAEKDPTILDLTLAYRPANPVIDPSKLNMFQTK